MAFLEVSYCSQINEINLIDLKTESLPCVAAVCYYFIDTLMGHIHYNFLAIIKGLEKTFFLNVSMSMVLKNPRVPLR